ASYSISWWAPLTTRMVGFPIASKTRLALGTSRLSSSSTRGRKRRRRNFARRPAAVRRPLGPWGARRTQAATNDKSDISLLTSRGPGATLARHVSRVRHGSGRLRQTIPSRWNGPPTSPCAAVQKIYTFFSVPPGGRRFPSRALLGRENLRG